MKKRGEYNTIKETWMTKNCKCSGRKSGGYTRGFEIVVVFACMKSAESRRATRGMALDVIFACILSWNKNAYTRELIQTMLFRVYDK